MIRVGKDIEKLSVYSPPWTGMDRSEYLRLDLNENTSPPPDHVIDALQEYIASRRIQMYPEYEEFVAKLERYAKAESGGLMPANGSDQAIDIILRAFLGKGGKMVMAQPGFPVFKHFAGVVGADLIGVPYDENLKFPFKDFLAAINDDTALIVLVNPDNPTGSEVSDEQILTIAESHPDIPVFVDEAYFEYTGKTVRPFMANLPNLIITRTFSKAFAMAGLRLGYIMAHPSLIGEFRKIRGPFDVNSCAMIAAESQIDRPQQWQSHVHETMNVSKPFMENFFRENNVRFYPGAAHFMLVEPDDRDGAVEWLKDHKILVRPMYDDSIKNTFRMNVGSPEQTKRFAECYKNYLTERS